jgi:hypothetical protein
MKNLCFLLLLGLLVFTGCARNYVVTLNNGNQLGAQGKPVLKGGSYYFKDARGEEAAVAAGRVTRIEPASSAARNKKTGFLD